MKAVMISIQPKLCAFIANGEKTIEIRKSKPKIDTPFKCYIYCTKDKYKHLDDLRKFGDGFIVLSFIEYNKTSLVQSGYLNGKVIGEFVCDYIDETYPIKINHPDKYMYLGDWVKNKTNTENTCLSLKELAEYGKGKPLYGWHISDLIIYDIPKELNEFFAFKQNDFISNCDDCPHGNGCYDKYSRLCNLCLGQRKYMTRPPQSWCYVEELSCTE